MKFHYINHKGERINFYEFPYLFQEGDLINWTYAYDSDNEKEIELYKKTKEFKVKIAVMPDNSLPYEERHEQYIEGINRLHDVLNQDAALSKEGKLYADDGSYIKCIFFESDKIDWKTATPLMYIQFHVVAKNPYWITETKKTFYPVGSDSEHPYLDYDYDYDYDYTPSITQSDYINLEHYAPCNFQLKIYGPAIDPSVTIGGVIRQVYTTLEEGQYLLIDSRDKTVKRVLNDGSVLNEFDNRRRKPNSIFELIKPGLNEIIWDMIGFDLTLFVERSEPRWR